VEYATPLTQSAFTVECTGMQWSHGSMSQSLVSPSCEYEYQNLIHLQHRAIFAKHPFEALRNNVTINNI